MLGCMTFPLSFYSTTQARFLLILVFLPWKTHGVRKGKTSDVIVMFVSFGYEM